jgi:hypothetical protein
MGSGDILLSLVPQPSLGLGLLHKIRLNFLEASQQFIFYRVGLLAPRPIPIPEDQASVFISPRGRVATHFSRLLWHAWVMVIRTVNSVYSLQSSLPMIVVQWSCYLVKHLSFSFRWDFDFHIAICMICGTSSSLFHFRLGDWFWSTWCQRTGEPL